MDGCKLKRKRIYRLNNHKELNLMEFYYLDKKKGAVKKE